MFPRLNTRWTKDWAPEFVGTLMFVVSKQQVLLIHKKTGHGAGKINGPGGKIDPGETVVDCAVRETLEEVGIRALNPRCVLEMRFVEEDGPQWLGFACVANTYEGNPIESDEARPFWCGIESIPYSEMWPDDAIWLPRILSEDISDPLVADFLFRDGVLLDYSWIDTPSIVRDFG